MNVLNRENYNELMFDLLENNISGSEREELIRQIESDPFYREHWEFWKQSKVSDNFKVNEAENEAFLDTLIIRPERRHLSSGRKWLVAASILLLLSLSVLFFKQQGTKAPHEQLAGKHTDKHYDQHKSGRESAKEEAFNKTALKEKTDNSNTEQVDNAALPKPVKKKAVRKPPVERPEKLKQPEQKNEERIPVEEDKEPAIALVNDTAETAAPLAFSFENGPAEENNTPKKRVKLSAVLTNTRLRLKKDKHTPAIELRGDESSITISLSKEE